MVREGTQADVPKAAAMRQRAWPESIITAEGMGHALDNVPERAELSLLAFEEDGEMLGWATASRTWWQADADAGHVQIAVDPARRGEGIGSALARAADEHLLRLGVRTTRSRSLDEPAAHALASRHGFAELGATTISSVDPRTVAPLAVPKGVELVAFGEIDDPVPLYELDMELSGDIPNETYDAIALGEWLSEYWRSPMIDDEASLAAFVDGSLAGLTMIRVDRPSGRAQNNLSGVRRSYRGRGLATILKSHSLHRAGQLGVTIALTDNDETNAPMLAVNTKLGYRPLARRIEWERRATT
jgi:GNAT superfamily N-acetyltransferase